MAPPQRVMLTGGNGFIGYAVLVGLLQAGVRRFYFGSFFFEKIIADTSPGLAHFLKRKISKIFAFSKK